MLDRFLHLHVAIQGAITISHSIKNKHMFIFTEREIEFLKHCHDVLRIFMRPTLVLQVENHCSISFIWSYINQVSKKLHAKCSNTDIISNFYII